MLDLNFPLMNFSSNLYKQVLEEEEYEVWLKRQLLAESSIENREELLLDSAQRLETNLTLLGREPDFRTCSASKLRAAACIVSVFYLFVHRLHWDRRQAAGGRPGDNRSPAGGRHHSLGSHRRQTGDGHQHCQRLQTTPLQRQITDRQLWNQGRGLKSRCWARLEAHFRFLSTGLIFPFFP